MGYLTLFLITAHSQIILFDNVQGIAGFSPPPTINAAHTIDVNFDELTNGPDSIQINFPDSSSTTVLKTDFIPLRGYLFVDDDDPPDTPDYWPDPNASLVDFSYKWSGRTTGYQVILTVHNGQIFGYINGSGKRYGIQLRLNGNEYWIVDYNLPNFPARGVDDAIVPEESNNIQNEQEDKTYISHLKSYDLSNKKITGLNRGTSQPAVLDMLIVWQEEARIEAGGSPSDPNDTQGIDLLMITAINHANESLVNSQTNTRVTKFHTAKLIGFSFSGLGFNQDVINFSNLESIKQLRTLVGADIVSGIVESDFTLFNACGGGFTQTIPNGIYSPGATFSDFAYNLVTQFCAILDDTFVHELGHNMGSNHARDEVGPALVTDIINNGFPDAFAWRSGNFKSIMSITQQTTDRVLYYSNPNVLVDGIVAGVLNEAYNARVIDQLSPAMALFRSRPDLIFADGFE